MDVYEEEERLFSTDFTSMDDAERMHLWDENIAAGGQALVPAPFPHSISVYPYALTATMYKY